VPRHERGLIDTSVVVDLESIDPERLPAQIAISAVTLAELAAGPHATNDPNERARRQERLQRAEAEFYAVPFDREAARAFGRIYSAATAAGRSSRARAADFLIAATAVSAQLPLFTRNPTDFAHLEHLLEVVPT
jgi:predicted nucleic acid-binding protein